MSANQYSPILYYSERCSTCKEIIQTLQGLNKASLYRFVCVDTTPRHLIPADVKAVPTIYNPQTKEVLTGKHAIFSTISKPVQSRREIPTQKAAGPTEPGAWSFAGAGGLTDPYTSFDGSSHIQDDQLYFSYLNAANTPLGQTEGPQRPDVGEGGSKTGRNNDVSSRLEAYTNQRNAEFQSVSRT